MTNKITKFAELLFFEYSCNPAIFYTCKKLKRILDDSFIAKFGKYSLPVSYFSASWNISKYIPLRYRYVFTATIELDYCNRSPVSQEDLSLENWRYDGEEEWYIHGNLYLKSKIRKCIDNYADCMSNVDENSHSLWIPIKIDLSRNVFSAKFVVLSDSDSDADSYSDCSSDFSSWIEDFIPLGDYYSEKYNYRDPAEIAGLYLYCDCLDSPLDKRNRERSKTWWQDEYGNSCYSL
jgi:hypothetical protein